MSARTRDPHAGLMKAMGAKEWDPLPSPQHEWQAAKGNEMLHRIWSVLCAHSVHGRKIGEGKDTTFVRSPYATEADGVTPLTMQRLVTILGEDGGNVRRGWRQGEELGIFRRALGRLSLTGTVTAAQIAEAKEERKKVCTDLLTKSDLLKIKGWPKDRQEEFHSLWNAARDYEQARIADALAREREFCSPVKDSIKSRFGLEIRRLQTALREPAPVPQLLLEFVQTGSVETVSTRAEGVDVQTGPSLLFAEELPERDSELPARPLRPAKTSPSSSPSEAAAIASALKIDDDAAHDLLKATRAKDPTVTAEEAIALAQRKIVQAGHGARNIVALLIHSVPKMVPGAQLDEIRARTRHGAANTAQEAFLRQEAESAARNTLADPRSTPADLRLAREVLNGLAKTVGGGQ